MNKNIKTIIVVILLIIAIIVVLVPKEIMNTDDGGSTTIYKGLFYEVVIKDRPPLGSKEYETGKAIYIFGNKVYEDYLTLPNNKFMDYPENKEYMNEITKYCGSNCNSGQTKQLLSFISRHNNNKIYYDEYGIIDIEGISNINEINDSKYYDIVVLDYYDYGFIKTIKITER